MVGPDMGAPKSRLHQIGRKASFLLNIKLLLSMRMVDGIKSKRWYLIKILRRNKTEERRAFGVNAMFEEGKTSRAVIDKTNTTLERRSDNFLRLTAG